MGRAASFGWVLLLVLPCIELLAHARIVGGVASDQEWRSAAGFVRSQWQAGDLVTAAPSWADPLLRLHLGDLMGLRMAGRSDNAAYERMWVLSVRDATAIDAPQRTHLQLEKRFGRVLVSRYALGKSVVLYDFVSGWRGAVATIRSGQREELCPLREGGFPRGGGLGKGVLYPLARRFECDARRPWLFVAPAVMEDLSLSPRHCLWQHPQGDEPIALTFTDVPLGDELVLYGGLYYEHERMRRGGPVQADVFVDGQLRGSLIHHDGEGWKRVRIAMPAGVARGTVRFEVHAQLPDKRSFCWEATTRRAAQAGELAP